MENDNLEIQEQSTDVVTNDNLEQQDNLELQDGELEDKGFNPDNIEFNDEYKFGDYDLSKFKENLNLNEANIEVLDSLTSEYSKLGLTQEQVEGVIGLMINRETEAQSPEAIKGALEKNLTYEEKRAYKANCNLLKEALAGTEEEKFYRVLTSDPTAVKILGKVINHIKGGGKNLNGARVERESRSQNSELTGEQAINLFNKYVSENLGFANKEEKQKELLGKLTKEEDKKYFREVLGL